MERVTSRRASRATRRVFSLVSLLVIVHCSSYQEDSCTMHHGATLTCDRFVLPPQTKR